MAAGNVMGNGQRYRKRRPLPAFLLILVLGVAATIVWLKVMNTDAEVTGAAHCDPPAVSSAAAKTPTQTRRRPHSARHWSPPRWTAPTPMAPSGALIRVVNASSQRGQARMVTESLRALGFTKIGDPGNDAIYGESMACRAQIRFGAQGAAAARTLSIVEPCAELIRDDRKDATVDVAIGEKFDELHPNRASRTLLEQLNDFAKQNPQAQGGLQADAPQPSSTRTCCPPPAT